MSKCDAIQCSATKGAGKFLCSRHWHQVPVNLQRTINSQYRAGREDYKFLSDPIYLGACVKAIDQIAERERVQGVNPYLRHLKLAELREERKDA